MDDVTKGTGEDEDRPYDDDVARIDDMKHDTSDTNSLYDHSLAGGTMEGVTKHYEMSKALWTKGMSKALRTKGYMSAIPHMHYLLDLPHVTGFEFS